MKEWDQRIALAELHGFKDFEENVLLFGTYCNEKNKCWTSQQVPDYLSSLDSIYSLRRRLNLDDKSNLEKRVRYINLLRTIVGRRMPKNKMGSPLTTDVDLLLAEPWEHSEAILKTFDKWVKEEV